MSLLIDRRTFERHGDVLPPRLRTGVRVFEAYARGRRVGERHAPGGHADLVLARLFRRADVDRVEVR
jgi:hypothetical protein